MKTLLTSTKAQLILFFSCYALSFSLAQCRNYFLSGIPLAFLAVYLYLVSYLKSGNLIDFRALFSLSWIGGQSLSCLKLSNLQHDWSPVTWICFMLAYLCFWLGLECRWFGRSTTGSERSGLNSDELTRHRLFVCITVTTAVSAAAFLTESMYLKFIPILSDKPHAYSYFHIPGVHYFTVCFIFVPALVLMYYKLCDDRNTKARRTVWLCTAISLVIPVLCVSRSQLIFTFLLAVTVYLYLSKNIRLRYIVMIIAVLIPACIVLTFFRHHAASYLNSVFDMKNTDIPIFITQPYIYISNNYDNFNCLVENLPHHTWGLRMLFPFFAFTGLKFRFEQLVSMPVYTTKQELTTLTMFYDAYYDFGIAGIGVFAWLLGYVCRRLRRISERSRNPITVLLYGQIAIYLLLSFFSTWFSNPTTWFWLIVTAMMYLYVKRGFDGKQIPVNE